jgi:Cd2+/Zn2+-exporting ATPase
MKLDTDINSANQNSCQDACCGHVREGQKQANGDCHDQTDLGTINHIKIIDFSQIDKAFNSSRKVGGKQEAEASTPHRRSGPKTIYRIAGMDCGDCAAKLEKRVASIPGVFAATVIFATGKMIVEHTLDDAVIKKAVQQAGYSAEADRAVSRQQNVKPIWWKSIRTLATLASGTLLACALVLSWLGRSEGLVTPLYALAMVTGGFHAARSGWYSLRSVSLDMNFLMTAAIVGAAVLGEWSEGATVAFLFSFGNTLQTYTMEKTRRSIESLMELAPPEALVRRNGQERRLPVEDIEVGDIIIVKPGERIAMDGTVVEGASAVNQATITGESIPVEKNAGDPVYAGTVNEQGALEIQVTQIAANSTLAKIFHLVEEAQGQKAPSQQFVDIFAKYYTPLVLVVAAGIMTIPWLVFQQPFAPWFYNGLVLLVISCPCALVISTPVSIVSAIGNASRHGVLIKGGAHLEEMSAIKAIAFDKTGTLTQGRPVVTDIIVVNGISETEALIIAASIEKRSEHPLARAITQRAKGLALKPALQFKALVGKGAQAEVDGRLMYIGNLRLFEELGYDVRQYEQRLADFEQQGKTVIFMGSQEKIEAMIAVADTLRQNSQEIVRSLHQAGLKHVAMLTGDNQRVAGAIAKTLALDAFYSDLLPADKVATIKQMQLEYGKVAMVGDGVNDAPALASATVGIAMGVAGSDTALETADIALMTDDLGKLTYIMQLSRKTVAIIKQNISFSILIKLIFILFLFFDMATLWLAVFADMGASLLVTLNAMRLMRRL